MANIGDILTAPENGMKRIDNTNINIGYFGSYATENDARHYNGSCVFSEIIGDSIEIVVNTKKLYFISVFNTNRTNNDHVAVYIDGEYDNSFTSYGDLKFQSIQYVKEFSKKEIHRFTFKNIASNGKYLCLDVIDIDEDGEIYPAKGSILTTPVNNMTRFSSVNMHLNYIGNWKNSNNDQYTDGIGDRLEFYFYGKQAYILDCMFSNRSNSISVILDDIKEDIVTEYSDTKHYALCYDTGILKEGVHKITMINNTTSSRVRMDVEFIDINGYLCDKTGKKIDITPCMISNTTPEPYSVSASNIYKASENEPFRAFTGVYVPTSNLVYASASKADTFNITLDFGKPTLFDSFILCTRLRDTTMPEGFPKTFEIQGSNDGINFETIKHFEKEDWEQGKIYAFELDKICKYQYARFDCTDILCNTSVDKWCAISQLRYLLNPNIKVFLLNVDGIYKNYDEENNILVDVEDVSILNAPLSENQCIYDIKKAIALLPSFQNVKLISNCNNKINLKGIKNINEMIVMRSDVYTNQIKHINNISLDKILSGNGNIKLAFSTDSGLTWQTYKDQKFKEINIQIPQNKYATFSNEELTSWENAKTKILNNGFDASILETIDFNTLDAKKFRFAIVFSIENYSDAAYIKNLLWNALFKDFLIECDNTQVERIIVGDIVKLHSNIEAKQIKVNILTAGITSGQAFDYAFAENKPSLNHKIIEGEMSYDDIGVASKEELEQLVKKINSLEGNDREYKGYYLNETERDNIVPTAEKNDYCVIASSISEDEKYKGKAIKYTYQDNGWEVLMVIPTSQVEINDTSENSVKETWSINQIKNSLNKKQNVLKTYTTIIKDTQLKEEETGDYKGFYKVKITHNLGCTENLKMTVYNLNGQTFNFGTFIDNIQENDFDLYSISKQSLKIIITEI